MTTLPVGLCWGTLWNATLPELIQAAAAHGFPTIAVTPPSYRDYVAAGGTASKLRTMLAEARVSVRVIDPLISGLPGIPPLSDITGQFRKVFEHDEAFAFEVAEACAAPVVNVAHFLGRKVPLRELADAIRGICGRAAQRELAVSLEFIPDTGMHDLVTAEEIRRLAGSPNLGILFDTWHFARSGGTTEQLLALPKGAINAFQLSDRRTPAPGADYVPMAGRSLPGEGEQDLVAIVSAVRANNPAVTAEIEVFNAELRELPADAAAKRTAEATRRWLAGRGASIRWS